MIYHRPDNIIALHNSTSSKAPVTRARAGFLFFGKLFVPAWRSSLVAVPRTDLLSCCFTYSVTILQCALLSQLNAYQTRLRQLISISDSLSRPQYLYNTIDHCILAHLLPQQSVPTSTSTHITSFNDLSEKGSSVSKLKGS